MARILVVDDNTSFRHMLKNMLEGLGHDVAEAKHGADAIAIFQDAPRELVITDLLMPEKDGFQTIRHFRKRFPKVKIIAMSGGGRLEAGPYLDVAEQLGALHTLIKPFSKDELAQAIDNALSR